MDDLAAPAGPEKFELRNILAYRFSLLSNRLTLWATRTYGNKFGMTSVEWRTLAPLGRGGPMSASRISEETVMDKSNVSRAVQRLIDRRLVRRTPDAADRRRMVVELTPEGRSLYDAMSATSQDRQDRLISVLTAAERREFDRLLRKIEGQAISLLDETGETGGG